MGLSRIGDSIGSIACVLSSAKKRIQSSSILDHFPKPHFLTNYQFGNFLPSLIRKISSPLPIALSTLMISNASSIAASEVTYTKINSMSEISTSFPNDTIIFFDIDDTLFDSPYMLGSKAWRRYIVQETKNSDQNWHDIFTLFLSRVLKVMTIEPATNQLIENLQKKGYGVCALTSRERNMWYNTPIPSIDLLTIKQLESANIRFDSEAFTNKYRELAKDSEYFGGVFFANTDLKGDYLRRILTNVPHPKKIVFIDDKLSQVESVASTLSKLGIDHNCYWYCATDDKSSKFNPLIANIQLYYLLISNGCQVISDQEAEIIAKKQPEKDAASYFEAILEYAKDLKPTCHLHQF
jgi:Protein of unknown function (DUF2608)